MGTLARESSDRSSETAEERIVTGDAYVASLRGRGLAVYLFGERVDVFIPWEHVFMDGEHDFAALQGRADVPTEDRLRILRLIENMTLGRNAVGYLTESMHGAGSPQAQRIQIARGMQLEKKKRLAKKIAGIDDG